jgi:thymidylate synthase ThyX
MEANETIILNHFFTNSDKPIFAFRNMPPALQNYIYTGISRFPDVRARFVKLLQDKGMLEKVAAAIERNVVVDEAIAELDRFAAERSCDLYFNMAHRSSAEGASVFLVSEQNPIYATEDQQDFYWPMTTMEFSTRYGTRFDIEHVYWDATIMSSEFADEAKAVVERNFEVYKQGVEAVAEVIREHQQSRTEHSELTAKVSALDAIRPSIPIAAHTTILLGGNVRSVVEHFGRMLSTCEDNFTKQYVTEGLRELSKAIPEFFERVQADAHVSERNARLQEFADNIFGRKFEPVKADVQLYSELSLEELALTQILYPYCTVPFEAIYNKVSGFSEGEKREVFALATLGRGNRKNPIRGFETRHLVFEVEAPWSLWKDFKRNRMNLRFHQDLRGLSGWHTPEIVAESSVAKEYHDAQRATAELVERVYQKYGRLSRCVASQASRKRFLLTMGPRQLTVLGELRTCGEGDKGYRIIASKMIELAKERNPRLFGHIIDNYRAVQK